MGSNGVQRTGKTAQKPKNRKFKKPYIKELWGLKKWDSGRWDGWGIILGFIPPFFGDIWSHITSETLFLVVIFSILDFSKTTQWSRHLFEKSIPGLFYSKPPRKVSATELELRPGNLKNRKINRPTCFQTLTFWWNLGFQKSWTCFMDFQGFPTPWISHPMDFGFSGRPRERPTKTKIGRQGRISRLPKGSLVNGPLGGT